MIFLFWVVFSNFLKKFAQVGTLPQYQHTTMFLLWKPSYHKAIIQTNITIKSSQIHKIKDITNTYLQN